MSVHCFHASSKSSFNTGLIHIIFKAVFIPFRTTGAENIKLDIKSMWADLEKILEAATGGIL